MLVVADGVGGWANHGIDPGVYSKSLVKHVLQRNKERPTENIRTITYIGV
jgi:protein phosphatase PTC7